MKLATMKKKGSASSLDYFSLGFAIRGALEEGRI